MARDIEREQIWSALRRTHDIEKAPAEPGETGGETGGEPRPGLQIEGLPELDPEYVRSAIREQLVPVAVDCYNSVLQDDIRAGGRLILEFTIVGAEDVGGVVERSEIGEDSDFDSPFLRECLRESMMTVTFDPPPGDGAIEVSYPLNFEPPEDD